MSLTLARPAPRRESTHARSVRVFLARHRIAVALGGVVVVGALVRFWALGKQGLWYDESVTAWLMRGSLGHVLTRLPHTESTPPLYYVVAWIWTRAFGDNELGLRSLSALAGVLSVPAVYLAARDFVGRRAGLAAAALIAVNPLLVWYSQEARAYSLLFLLATLSLWLCARARARPSPARLAIWAVAAAAAVCTHYFAVFLVASEAAALLAMRGQRLLPRLVAVAFVGATAAALVGLANRQSTRVYYFAELPLPYRIEQTVRHFMVGFTPPARPLLTAVAGLAALAMLSLAFLRSKPAERKALVLVASIGAAAAAVPVALAVAGADYFNSRNMIAVLGPFAILAGAGASVRRPRFAGPIAAVVLAAVSVAMVVAMQRDASAQRPPWHRVADGLRATSARKRAIVLDGSRTWASPLSFYLHRTRWVPWRGTAVTEIDVVRRLPHRGCGTLPWWGPSCELQNQPPRRVAPARGFRAAASRNVAGFNIERFLSPRPVRIYQHRAYDELSSPLGRATTRRHVLVTRAR